MTTGINTGFIWPIASFGHLATIFLEDKSVSYEIKEAQNALPYRGNGSKEKRKSSF